MWFVSYWEFKVIALRERVSVFCPPLNFSLAFELHSQEDLNFRITSEMPLCSPMFLFLHIEGFKFSREFGSFFPICPRSLSILLLLGLVFQTY